MKATGVVRRIDDLGRIVIPKEIRKNFKINEGDSLEIFVDNNSIQLKKYSLLDDMVKVSLNIVDAISKIYKKNVIVTDKEKVIAASKDLSDEYLNKELSINIKNRINDRCEFLETEESSIIFNGNKISSYFLMPILSNSDSLGCVILLDDDITDDSKTLIRFINYILVKKIEE